MGPWARLDDAMLIAAVRAGEDEPFEELYRRYLPVVTATVRACGAGQASEEVVQEVFIAALRHIRARNRAIDLRPWLHEIARNKTKDLRRRRARAPELVTDIDQLKPSDRLRLADASTPESALSSKERLDRLREAFSDLPERQRRVLVMREFDGRSYREIGKRLHLSRSVVENTLFRARRRIACARNQIGSLILPGFARPFLQDLSLFGAGGERAVAIGAAALAGGVIGTQTDLVDEPAPRSTTAVVAHAPIARAHWQVPEPRRASPHARTAVAEHSPRPRGEVGLAAGPVSSEGAATRPASEPQPERSAPAAPPDAAPLSPPPAPKVVPEVPEVETTTPAIEVPPDGLPELPVTPVDLPEVSVEVELPRAEVELAPEVGILADG